MILIIQIYLVGEKMEKKKFSEQDVEIMKDGKIYQQKYSQGKASSELQIIGETTEKGTKVTFLPDPEIFTETEYHFDTLSSRLRELAFLNKGIYISLADERNDKRQEYHYDGGIISFVEFLNENKNPIHTVIHFEKEKHRDVRHDM